MISYLQVENLSKSYGDLSLFENISFGIGQGQKIALIAKNGTGKTSLLNIISGKNSQDNGEVTFRNDLKIAYLEQNPDLNNENTVLNEVFNSPDPILSVIRDYEKIIIEDNQELMTGILEKMDHYKAWDYENKVKQILSKLKITNFDQLVGQLSGGQKRELDWLKF